MKQRILLRLLLGVLILGLVVFTSQAASGHSYVLWEGLEPDKCGVIWLIKTFVDRDAVFKFVKKGTAIYRGIPLDTPDSKIQRRQNLCAFETALQEYKLKDPVLKRIGRILWDIEINKWEKKVTAESPGLSVIIYGLIKKEPDAGKALEESNRVFDALYQGLEGG